MSENIRTDEILNTSIQIDRDLKRLGEKISSLANKPLTQNDAMECVSMITLMRSGINDMNKKIIQNNISEDKQLEYLKSNTDLFNTIYQDNQQFSDTITGRTNEYNSEEILNENSLPPVL